MIAGRITPEYQALITLTFCKDSGDTIELVVALDTGFSEYLMLPRRIINALESEQVTSETALLANGSAINFPVYEVTVLWDEEERIIPAYASDGQPLLGVKLLHGSLVTLEFVPNGSVTIE